MQFTVPRLIKDKHQHFSIFFYAQGKRYRISNGKKFGGLLKSFRVHESNVSRNKSR